MAHCVVVFLGGSWFLLFVCFFLSLILPLLSLLSPVLVTPCVVLGVPCVVLDVPCVVLGDSVCCSEAADRIRIELFCLKSMRCQYYDVAVIVRTNLPVSLHGYHVSFPKSTQFSHVTNHLGYNIFHT